MIVEVTIRTPSVKNSGETSNPSFPPSKNKFSRPCRVMFAETKHTRFESGHRIMNH